MAVVVSFGNFTWPKTATVLGPTLKRGLVMRFFVTFDPHHSALSLSRCFVSRADGS
jgi:hypothetical protein